MLDFEILRLDNLLIKISCIAPLSPAVIVVRGFFLSLVLYAINQWVVFDM